MTIRLAVVPEEDQEQKTIRQLRESLESMERELEHVRTNGNRVFYGSLEELKRKNEQLQETVDYLKTECSSLQSQLMHYADYRRTLEPAGMQEVMS